MSSNEQTLRQLMYDATNEQNYDHPTVLLAEAALFYTQSTSACRERALSRAIEMMLEDFPFLCELVDAPAERRDTDTCYNLDNAIGY